VKRLIGAGGIQIVLQCLTCGSSIGTAQAHAAYPDFLTYPFFDEALALSGRGVVHPLAAQASRLLGYPVTVSHEVFPLSRDVDLLACIGQGIGVREIVRRLQPKRAWGSNPSTTLSASFAKASQSRFRELRSSGSRTAIWP
jgi:hypothetical protein